MMSKQLRALLERKEKALKRKQDLYNEAQALVSLAQDNDRDLSASENKRHKDCVSGLNKLNAEINEIDIAIAAEQRVIESELAAPAIANYGGDGRWIMPGAPGVAGGSGPKFVNVTTGQPIRSYRINDRMSEVPTEEPIIGHYLQARVLGDINGFNLRYQAALNTIDDSEVLPTFLSPRIVDMARSASVCQRAGAVSIDLPGSELRIAKVTADPTPYWRPELSPVTSSKPTLGSVTLRPKTVAVLIPISIEWAEDSANGPQMIEEVVRRTLALAIDKAALVGSGTGSEPEGVITNTDEVTQRPAVGVPTNYDDLVNAIGAIKGANYQGDVQGLAWIRPPAVATFYQTLKTGISGDQTPLMQPEWVQQIQKFETTSIAGVSSPHEYAQVVGDFREMVFGFRMGGIRMEVFRSGTAKTPDSPGDDLNALTQLAIWVRAFIRFDVATLRPDWFANLPGANVG